MPTSTPPDKQALKSKIILYSIGICADNKTLRTFNIIQKSLAGLLVSVSLILIFHIEIKKGLVFFYCFTQFIYIFASKRNA